MQSFMKWMLETIRSEGASFNWVEENRFEWTASTMLAVSQIVTGKTIVLVTDRKRKWFQHYISSTINQLSNDRPMVPLISLDRIYPEFDEMTSGDAMDMLADMLDLSFAGNYFFWYVGKGSDPRSEIAKRADNSCLWLLDEEFGHAMKLRSFDPYLDIKLLQLYRLFDLSLNAVLFGEVDADE
ncbi:HobA family DNA replication regulator [Sulfurimonas sp. HSL-3221]|uniref:HobA family DNA replication regulator n=1 Tax=Sulfurimonas diazotrophicus TaxID=3131939 RepID=A0ABZ3H9G3_9BACT|nr:HobA family DNA replication regulator [Sulfurimonas sp. HSL-3221]UFS61698.1 HobA family DNA replication regulator [Sulfurimonas sp. HSL-3221]